MYALESDPAARDRKRQLQRATYAPRSAIAYIVCAECDQLSSVRMSTATICRRAECRMARKARTTAARRERDGRENYGYTDAAAESYHRRRALKMNATVERFSHAEVFERDDWTCGICSTAVDPDLKWPDPMSVSLDHIIPLALGGEHSRANTQCSHLTCNVRKGARVA